MVTTNLPLSAISFFNTFGSDVSRDFVESTEFRDWLADYLLENQIKVTFTKKDGTLRTMHCTRNVSLIPVEKHPKGSSKQESTSSLSAFDLEINDWRSFTLSTITKVEFCKTID